MLTLADMHLASRNNDVSQFESGFISDANNLIAQYTAAGTKVYALTLGDQSWDLYWYANNFALDDAAQKISKLNCPVYHIMGNHDNDPYVAADFGAAEAFRNFIGPTYYSFNLGKVHDVVLVFPQCKSEELLEKKDSFGRLFYGFYVNNRHFEKYDKKLRSVILLSFLKI